MIKVLLAQGLVALGILYLLSSCATPVHAEQRLRSHLDGEKRRLEAAIRAAAAEGSMDEVGRLQPQLNDIDGDRDLLDAEVVVAAVAARLDSLPQLPPDFRDILRRGAADVANWQKLQRIVQQSITIAGNVAEGVSTVAQLAMKYGKFLI